VLGYFQIVPSGRTAALIRTVRLIDLSTHTTDEFCDFDVLISNDR
jgi:hypothetical protein